MSDEEKIIREVFDLWAQGPEGCKESWRRYAAPDIDWWNSARGSTKGMQANLDAMDQIGTLGIASFKVTMKHMASDPGRVWVERTEDFYAADGTHLYKVPVVGVIEFKGDKMTQWRDYCVDWVPDLIAQNAARTEAANAKD